MHSMKFSGSYKTNNSTEKGRLRYRERSEYRDCIGFYDILVQLGRKELERSLDAASLSWQGT